MHIYRRPDPHISLCTGIKAPDSLSLDIHSFEFFNFLLLSIPIKMQYIEDCPAWMLSVNFLAGIHFLPVPARLEPGSCSRKHFGNGEQAETLRIMSGKLAGAVEEVCTTVKLSPLWRQQKAKLILTSCKAFFSAHPALTRESQLGSSQKAFGKVRGFAYIQGHGHGLP